VAKTHKKSQGQRDKENPPGDLEKQGHSRRHQEKSAQSIISPDLGLNNSATMCAKGKKKSKERKVSFNGKKAAKPTKLHK
jgi:hypothetical protein